MGAFEGFPVDRMINADEIIRPKRIGLGWSNDGTILGMRFEDAEGRGATIEIWCGKIVEILQREAAKAMQELQKLGPDIVNRGKVAKYDPMISSQGEALLKACEWFIRQCQGDCGTGEGHWQQFPEYRAARIAVAAAKGDPPPVF